MHESSVYAIESPILLCRFSGFERRVRHVRRLLAANLPNNSPLNPTFSVVAFFALPNAFFVILVRYFSLIHWMSRILCFSLAFSRSAELCVRSEATRKVVADPLQAAGGGLPATRGGNALI
jgi:hypothetical protein